MSDTAQLDLFAPKSSPPEMPCRASSNVVSLPVDTYIFRVRETARLLERRKGPAADRFWQLECRRYYARLQVDGVPAAERIERVNQFAIDVYEEMRRAAWSSWYGARNGGAA